MGGAAGSRRQPRAEPLCQERVRHHLPWPDTVPAGDARRPWTDPSRPSHGDLAAAAQLARPPLRVPRNLRGATEDSFGRLRPSRPLDPGTARRDFWPVAGGRCHLDAFAPVPPRHFDVGRRRTVCAYCSHRHGVSIARSCRCRTLHDRGGSLGHRAACGSEPNSTASVPNEGMLIAIVRCVPRYAHTLRPRSLLQGQSAQPLNEPAR